MIVKPLHFTYLLLGSLLLPAHAQTSEASEKADATREYIKQWVETERIISEESINWKSDQEHMQTLLNVYQKELSLLNEELEKAGSSSENVDQKREELTNEVKAYQVAQSELAQSLVDMVPRLKRVIECFPPVLSEKVAENVAILDGAETPRQRLQSLTSILSEAERFNRNITVIEEVRKLASGKEQLVNVMYLGLCRAYYATASGSSSGVGTPSLAGWQWQEDESIATPLNRAIATYRNEKTAELVKLPIQIFQPVEGGAK